VESGRNKKRENISVSPPFYLSNQLPKREAIFQYRLFPASILSISHGNCSVNQMRQFEDADRL